ncbi:hypothetical protein LCM19_02685 [Qipengyuania flava]|nr:hypothetical protein [Qipengyuania flava]
MSFPATLVVHRGSAEEAEMRIFHRVLMLCFELLGFVALAIMAIMLLSLVDLGGRGLGLYFAAIGVSLITYAFMLFYGVTRFHQILEEDN